MAYVDGRAAGDERRPAAGQNRGFGLWRASPNRDVTPAAWLSRADGRTGGYKQSAAERRAGLLLFLATSSNLTSLFRCIVHRRLLEVKLCRLASVTVKIAKLLVD